jgi:hypothetical protein
MLALNLLNTAREFYLTYLQAGKALLEGTNSWFGNYANA